MYSQSSSRNHARVKRAGTVIADSAAPLDRDVSGMGRKVGEPVTDDRAASVVPRKSAPADAGHLVRLGGFGRPRLPRDPVGRTAMFSADMAAPSVSEDPFVIVRGPWCRFGYDFVEGYFLSAGELCVMPGICIESPIDERELTPTQSAALAAAQHRTARGGAVAVCSQQQQQPSRGYRDRAGRARVPLTIEHTFVLCEEPDLTTRTYSEAT